MVDASINSVEDSLLIPDYCDSAYVDVEFFKYLKYTPIFDLVWTAKETIQYLMNKGVSDWSPDSQNVRMEIYRTYMRRLEEVK